MCVLAFAAECCQAAHWDLFGAIPIKPAVTHGTPPNPAARRSYFTIRFTCGLLLLTQDDTAGPTADVEETNPFMRRRWLRLDRAYEQPWEQGGFVARTSSVRGT